MSLLELLIGIAIVAIVLTTAARAFSLGLNFDLQSQVTRNAYSQRVRFEDRMTALIRGANLHGAGDYFISPIPLTDVVQQVPLDDGLGSGSMSLVFTGNQQLQPKVLNASGLDFPTMNTRYGAWGAAVETAFSLTPVGNAQGRTGLFLRMQCPADSDPTQGGTEGLISDKVQDIRFQFFDGTQWTSTWDSGKTEKGKLPQKVQIQYLFVGDDQPHTFFVRLPLYDSTPPSTSSTQSGGGSSQNPGSGNSPFRGGN
jgi:type II secretory pathway pseudopilin PulG